MRVTDIVRLRLRSLFARASVERELDEELRYHREQEVEENMARGMSREDARRAALQSTWGFEQRKEECRDMRGLSLLDNLARDVRFAIRQLRKNPGFTTTAVLMLALGMCASVAIFAFVDAALIKPLPYRNPERLAAVFETTAMCPRCNVSYLNYRDWKGNDTPFRSLDVWGFSRFLLRTPTGPQVALGNRVSDGFFRTLGVSPILGRDFYEGEDAPGAPHTVILSFGAWKKRFGGDRQVIGQTVTLSDTSYTIIGVLPPDFHFAPHNAEFWAALNNTNSCEQRRACHSLFGLARLKDGASIESALARMKMIQQQLEKRYPDANRDTGADVVALSEVVAGNVRPVLLVLLGGAGLLLLIACVNASGLLVVRSESRKREIAVRNALGASRGRILGQFATEGLILVTAGSALGLGFAYWTMRLLTGLISADRMDGMPFLRDLGFNIRVLCFAGSITLLAAVLFCVVPALSLSAASLRGDLNEGGRGAAGTLWRRLGSRLLVLELATAVVLLVGAGLLGRSLYRLLNVNIGFEPAHLATLQVETSQSYAEDAREMALEREIVKRIKSLPGVRSVGLSSSLPVKSWDMMTRIRVNGRPWHGERNEVPERDVSPQYFATLGAQLLRGRYFTDAENDPSKPRVTIVDQAFAKQYFPGEDPVGKRISYVLSQDSMEIVGIVNDIKEGGLDTANRSTIYVPFNQSMRSSFNVTVRTGQAEETLLPALIATIRQIDPEITTSEAGTMSDSIARSQAAWLHRSSAWLVGGFAALALLLSVVGLYGVVAYSVSQRTREIGVRIAVGASSSSVYRLILTEALWLTSGGIVIGLVCAVLAARLMRGLLFEVQSWDPLTLGAVVIVLAISAQLASYIPARRAVSVNPAEALRAE